MASTAADVLIDSIHDWGVDTVFGLPGDGINGIMEALRTRQDKIRFVQVRHEEAAAFMACAYAKYTGKLGVCLATSGPGGIHLLNGLYDAKLDGQPVLALDRNALPRSDRHARPAGRGARQIVRGRGRLQRASHGRRNTWKIWPTWHAGLRWGTGAWRTSPSPRICRKRKSRGNAPPKRNLPHHTSDVRARSARLPDVEDLRKAAEILNAGKKIAILAGQGALHAGEQLEQTAEKLAAPIIKALLGKAAVPDDSPYTTGGIGLLGTKPSQTLWKSATRC